MKDSTWTYALVAPDGLMGGALARIADLLTASGFRIMAVRGVTLNAEAIDDLYSDPKPRPSGSGSGGVPIPIRMFSDLYQIWPGCVLILHRPAGFAVETMLECKGYTRPELADAGSIRHMAENVFLNYGHCPDSQDNVLRELSILLHPRDLASISVIADAGGMELEDLIGLAAFTESLPVLNSWDAVSFPAISVRICLRVIMLLAALVHTDDEKLYQLRTAKTALVQAGRKLLGGQTSHERMITAQDAVPAIITIIRDLAAGVDEDVFVGGLKSLADLYDLSGPREIDYMLALAKRGVVISALERIVLESHDFTFRLHPELIGLYGAR